MFTIAGLFILFAAVIGAGAMTAIIGYLLHRIRQLEQRQTSDLAGKALYDQIDTLQQEVSRLTERVEFSERLLAGGTKPEGEKNS